MTPSDFTHGMARLGAAFRKDLTEATYAVYLDALGDVHADDFAQAVRWAIKHKTFLPTPAELLDRTSHERTARLRSLPAADTTALPEWVTEPADGADVQALVAELLPKLTAATKRAEAIRPDRRPGINDPNWEAHLQHPRGSAEDMAWRMERARSEIKRLREHCAAHGIPWVQTPGGLA